MQDATETTATQPTRRRFLDWFLGTAFGALAISILYPVARFVSPPQMPEASTNEVEAGLTTDPELLDKGFRIVRFGVEPVILIRVAEGDYRAFTATCTHLDCVVGYQKDRTRIWCNCHNGEYDLEGRNVAGPPPRPLTAFTVNVVQKSSGQPGMIVISKG